MKQMKLVLPSFLFTIFLGATCCDEDPLSLPPETQTGANTFGCLVNGELFVAERGYGPLGGYYLSGGYEKVTKTFGISAYGRNGNVGFGIINPKEGKNLMYSAGYHKKNLLYENVSDRNSFGHVYITKFDTINKIISGNFKCEIPLVSAIGNYNKKDSTINITQGRFDMQLTMYDY